MRTTRPTFLNIAPVRTWQKIGRVVGFVLCLAALAAFFTLAGREARADTQFTYEGVTFILTDKPCDRMDIKITAAYGGVSGDEVNNMKLATVMPEGEAARTACWFRQNAERIIVVDEFGNGGFVPLVVGKQI